MRNSFGGVVTPLAVITLSLLTSLVASAQDVPSAQAVLLKYAEATKAYDTAAMSSLMHPDALKRFRSSIDSALNGPKRTQAEKELLPLFSVTTVADYLVLSDAEAYKRLNDTIGRSAPGLIEMLAKSSYELVGGFVKDDVAYVTYNLKIRVEGKPVNQQVTQALRAHEGRWLLMLPATADATIAGIEQRFK